jgi:hypothetical protein
MESWRFAWRNGFAPNISTIGMMGLQEALVKDDPKLLQGATSQPPPLMCVQDWKCEATDAIGFCGFSEHLSTHGSVPSVGEIEQYFARRCSEADQKLGEPAACRLFLNWWDDTPRDEVRNLLLEEINLELKNRKVNRDYTNK